MNKVSEANHHRSDGQCEMSLLSGENDLTLTNNKKLGDCRMKNLKSKFDRDERHKEEYVKLMNENVKERICRNNFPLRQTADDN